MASLQSWRSASSHSSEFPGDRQYDQRSCKRKLVILENNPIRRVWQIIVVFMLIWTATVFPYRLVFFEFGMSPTSGVEEETEHEILEWQWINNIIDWLFYVDLVLCFFFSYKSKGKEVTDLRKICVHYLRTSFLLNLIACLPPAIMELILACFDDDSDAAGVNKSSRMGRLQRMSHLARTIRITRIAKFATLLDNPVWHWIQSLRGVRIVNFFGFLILAVHMFACGWFLCAALHEDPEETWVYRRSVGVDGTALISQEPWEQWLHSMYFVLTVFTTVGFGDMSAMTVGEILYVMCTMIVGAIVNSIIFSEVITVITSVDHMAREVNEQKSVVQGFAVHTHLDTLKPDLVRRLTDWIGNSKSVRSCFDRERMREMITGNAFPRRLTGELPDLVFEGRLTTNMFISLCRQSGKLPPRFPLLVSVACSVRYMECKEVVYYCFDHSWNIFLVQKGTFAHIGKPGPAGGVSRLPALVVCTVNMSQRPVANHLRAYRKWLGLKHSKSFDSLTSDGNQPNVSALSPYQLMGVGNYFGETELLLGGAVARQSCVRCESKAGGCVLVLAKPDVLQLMAEFPRCAGAWRAAAFFREEHRKVLLHKLTRRIEYDALAATSIQQYYRYWKSARKGDTPVFSTVPASIHICRNTRPVPEHAKVLTEDVRRLREEMVALSRRVEQDVVSVHTAVDELKAQLMQALCKHSLASCARQASPLGSGWPTGGTLMQL